ncbi:MAG: Do family serine endopeptidase [Chitinivorax sp.]
MKRIWLIFAQSATIALGVCLALTVVKPGWLDALQQRPAQLVTVREAAPVVAAPGKAVLAGSYAMASAKAQPAVVNIYTSKQVKVPLHPLLNDPFFRRFFGERVPYATQRASSLGSGVIVSAEGYIVTNNHVVESADEIEVALSDGRTASAMVIGSDPESDLAVIRIQLGKLPVATIGDSDRLQVGDVVLAIGNPFGVGQTVTMGIVSALGRTQTEVNPFESFIQTDAAINPGNSGGALIDAQGNLIGINTAIYSKTGASHGIGFAIPVNAVRKVMEQIMRQGSVTRGWLGVEMQNLTPDLAASFNLPVKRGIIIAGVVRNGPAYQAGIRPGDVLIEIAGQPVTESVAAINQIAAIAPGSSTPMTIVRNGQALQLQVEVGKRPRIEQDIN